jgi:hypothetical protein
MPGSGWRKKRVDESEEKFDSLFELTSRGGRSNAGGLRGLFLFVREMLRTVGGIPNPEKSLSLCAD